MNLFDFDYDLTFMVFFLDSQGRVYSRYGGRDARDADSRQSLEGLRYTMQSVLEMHRRENKQYAVRPAARPMYARDVTGWYGGGCMHCHQVKEAMHEKLRRDGQWTRDQIWRFPLPDNVGIRLDTHRGNVVVDVSRQTPAAKVGLRAGDVLQTLGSVPIHSIADAQFALDRAPATGALKIDWLRDSKIHQGTLELTEGWKRSDITWRASVRWRFVPSLPMSGEDLTPQERTSYGLSKDQLAFRTVRQKPRATEAGFQLGDVVMAMNGETLDMTVAEFRQHIRREFLVGDTIQLTVLRDGKRLEIPLTLTGQ